MLICSALHILCLLCLKMLHLCLFKPEHCSFQVMLFHMLFMPKYAERKASRMDKSLFEAHPENRDKEENRRGSKNERRIRNQKTTDAVLLLCGNWVFIIITEIYPTVTRNRWNSAFCAVIGFTVTRDYGFFGNVLHGIGKCVFSR